MVRSATDYFLTGAEADELWPLIRNYHYSRRMPSAPIHSFAWRKPGGLFGDTGEPVVGAIYGNPVNKYLTDTIELLRLVRSPECTCPLSQFLCWTLRWLRKNTPHAVCVTYADSAQDHHGGIYQACGFYYCGEKGVPFDKVAGFMDGRGHFQHARSINSRYGTHKKDIILAKHPTWQVVEALPKHFYIKPLRQQLKPILRRLNLDLFPYPKPYAARPLDEPLPRGASDVQPVGAAP